MNNKTREITMIGVLVALMAATAPFSIPLGGVGITMQTLFVFLAGILLDYKKAFQAMVIYIILGVMGLPIFMNGGSGLATLIGHTGGFIIAFPFAAALTSIVKDIKILNNTYIDLFVKMFVINLLLYMIGGAYFMYVTKWTLSATVLTFIVFIPGDIIKIIAAIYVATYIRKEFTYEHS